MEIHRTEMLQAPGGQLSIVQYVGLFPHAGNIRQAILQLKYQDKKHLSRSLAMLMAAELEGHDRCDVVTWAPTTMHRRQKRGFDQSELIARHCAAEMGVRHSRLLRRDNDGRQTGSGREERLVRPSFVARPGLEGKHIWVIDDVMTTGATLRACAEALVSCGATRVMCIAMSWVE
jgi:competence protein ComFC